MTSAVDICSQALMLVGAEPINALTDNTPRARLCDRMFIRVYEAVMRAYLWDCCIKRVILSPLSTAPEFEYSYKYQVPSDCLRVLGIDAESYPLEFKVEGQTIVCNESAAYVRYLFANDVIETWDAGLVDVVIYALASEISYTLTRNATLSQYFKNEYLTRLRLSLIHI
jgi:hypothetical protein